jgi:hypothetical protein
VVTGFVGGESHDSFLIPAAKGKSMTVQISWRHEGGNRAEFTVSDSPTIKGGEPVRFGKVFDDGNRWTGKIPRTADY